MRATRPRTLGALAAAWLAGSVAWSLYAWRASKRVDCSETLVFVPDLPPGLEGLRILHVADTHFPANGESLPRFLEAAGRQRYDLVIATGDYVDTTAGWEVALEAFRRLDPALGVFAVIGGHERYPARDLDYLLRLFGRTRRPYVDPAPFLEGLREAGVRVLINEHTTAEIGGEMVRFIGVDDAYHGLDRLAQAKPPAGGGGFPILLSHSPDGLLDPAAHDLPLAFCGHTHGGQIRIPGYGAPTRHARSVGRRDAAGVVRIGATQAVISRGFGTTSIPLRFACPPELGVVELRRAP